MYVNKDHFGDGANVYFCIKSAWKNKITTLTCQTDNVDARGLHVLNTINDYYVPTYDEVMTKPDG